MQWGTQTYRAGALERLEDARILKDSSRCALSMYAAGLAVEGMLRSLQWIGTKQFDERHDLRRIAVRIESLGLLRPGKRDSDFVSKVQGVARLWSNSLRFAADHQLRRFLRDMAAARNLDDGEVRRVCAEHYDRCSEIVRRCDVILGRHKKSGGADQ